MNEHSKKIRATAGMTVEKRQARRTEMVELRGKGWSLQAVADKFGISKEAARLQIAKGPIVKKWGAPPAKAEQRVIEERLARWRARPQTDATKARIATLEKELADADQT